MMCKKIMPFFIIVMAMASIAVGQDNQASKFYVKLYAGYGLLTPGSFRFTSQSLTTFEVSSTGMGSGLHFGGGFGIILNDFINLGIDADYLKGKTLQSV